MVADDDSTNAGFARPRVMGHGIAGVTLHVPRSGRSTAGAGPSDRTRAGGRPSPSVKQPSPKVPAAQVSIFVSRCDFNGRAAWGFCTSVVGRGPHSLA
jgi:hypothetical protein